MNTPSGIPTDSTENTPQREYIARMSGPWVWLDLMPAPHAGAPAETIVALDVEMLRHCAPLIRITIFRLMVTIGWCYGEGRP